MKLKGKKSYVTIKERNDMKKQYTYGILIIIFTISAFVIKQLYFQSENVNQYSIDKRIIAYLTPLRKGVVTSVSTMRESKHRILSIDINEKGGEIPGQSDKYYIKLHLADYDPIYPNIYIIKRDIDIGHVIVLIPDGSGYKRGGFKDIHIGNTILLDQTNNFKMTGKTRSGTIIRKIIKIN